MQCFLCKKSDYIKKYQLITKNILACKNDGLFLAKATASRYSNINHKDYFNNPPHPTGSNRSYFLKKLATINRLTGNKIPYFLDIGCGWGDFEEVLEIEKIPYLGIDINKQAIAICRKKKLHCKLSTVEQLSNRIIKRSFSVITMFQVIEHLKNPLLMLLSAKKLLKKNGILLLTTPNNDSPLRKLFGSRWSVYNDPSHFVFYNKKTLGQLLTLAGFNRIEVKPDSWRFLSSKYVFSRLMNIHSISSLTTIYKLLTTFSVPVPTDPCGDLVATAQMDYD